MGKAGKRQKKFIQKGGLQAAIKHRRTGQKVRRAKAAQADRGEAALHGRLLVLLARGPAPRQHAAGAVEWHACICRWPVDSSQAAAASPTPLPTPPLLTGGQPCSLPCCRSRQARSGR